MDYFSLLNLKQEPFSNSPDPEFFFQSRLHCGCLQKLELSIRLRRGLSVVLGEVGTGKTTLCRHLIRRFTEEKGIHTHLILDPFFPSPLAFLKALTSTFGLPACAEEQGTEWQIKDEIQKHLFRLALEEGKIIAVIIDEGQKIPDFCVEILRELLNYEANEYKLLQIVIFAQTEFKQTLLRHANFNDRINYFTTLGPLGFRETMSMIRFRLNRATGGTAAPSLFSFPGFMAIYCASGGYPRRIVHLCHQTLLTLIVQNKTKAGWSVVRWAAAMTFPAGRSGKGWWGATALGLTAAAVVAFFAFHSGRPGALDGRFTGKAASVQSVQESSRSEAADSGPLASQRNAGPSRGGVETAAVQRTPVLSQGEAEPSPSLSTGQPLSPSRESNPPMAVTSKTASLLSGEQPPAQGPPGGVGPKPHSTPKALTVNPPRLLGQIPISKGETLEELIRSVYGTYSANHLQALKRSNPHLRDMRTIDLGKMIAFPAIPVPKPCSPPQYLVALSVKDSLQESYAFMRTCHPFIDPHDNSGSAAVSRIQRGKSDAPSSGGFGGRGSVQLVPFWSPDNGLRFAVTLQEAFSSLDLARRAASALPHAWAGEAQILGDWSPDTIFFARCTPGVNRSD